MRAGVAAPFSIDLTDSNVFGIAPTGLVRVELWGASTSCMPEELLWTSPNLENVNSWQTFCGTLRPSRDYPFVVLGPVVAPGGTQFMSYLLVDNLGLSASCSAP